MAPSAETEAMSTMGRTGANCSCTSRGTFTSQICIMRVPSVATNRLIVLSLGTLTEHQHRFASFLSRALG